MTTIKKAALVRADKSALREISYDQPEYRRA